MAYRPLRSLALLLIVALLATGCAGGSAATPVATAMPTTAPRTAIPAPIASPSSPPNLAIRLAGQIGGAARAVAIVGPAAPREVGVCPVPGHPTRLAAERGYTIYVAAGEAGLLTLHAGRALGWGLGVSEGWQQCP